MASGVERHLVAGHARQHVRFAQERRSRHEHPLDPKHSPFHQARAHRDSRNQHRRSQRLGLDCGWREFRESGHQSCGTTTTSHSGVGRQICQRQWTTYVCQVSLGRRRPDDRQHQRLSLRTQFHSLLFGSYQVGGQDGLDRAPAHPLVRVSVGPQLATRIPGRSNPYHGAREWMEPSGRPIGQPCVLGRECSTLSGLEHELQLAFHQLEHSVSLDRGRTHPVVARVMTG